MAERRTVTTGVRVSPSARGAMARVRRWTAPGGSGETLAHPPRSRASATTSTGSRAWPTEAAEVVAYVVAIERALAALAPAVRRGIYGHGGTRAINSRSGKPRARWNPWWEHAVTVRLTSRCRLTGVAPTDVYTPLAAPSEGFARRTDDEAIGLRRDERPAMGY